MSAGQGTRPSAEPWQPQVTVIVPMLNEAGFIEPCIEALLGQTYPAELIEILVVDAGSEDGSREAVRAITRSDPRVRLLDNPRGRAAAAANIGILSASNDVLCFLSAHGVPERDYIATSVRLLHETGGTGVGGRYVHEGTDHRSQAIGLAMASPLGMASPHRSLTTRAEVDTISHPTFHRQPLIEVGGYDETLDRNEDYEFNYRLRADGGKLFFSPEITSVYRPRSSLRALSRQFYDYGRHKATVMRRHPRSIRPRHLVPPAAVVVGAVMLAGATFGRGRRVTLLAALGYVGVELAAVAKARPHENDASVATFVAALPVMHASWGFGVVVGLVSELRSGPTTPPARPLGDRG